MIALSVMGAAMRFIWIGLLFGLATMALAGLAQAAEYGALAVGISGNEIGTGAGLNFPTQDAADATALRQCEKLTNNCRVVGQFSGGGCGYITVAIANGTCWGSGATAAKATTSCQSHGCGPCKPPIGGCVKP